MKLAYMCFVSNGFDDHYMTMVCSGMNVREFLPNVVKEYWKSSSWLTDAAGPYIVALDLESFKARPLGLFKLERDGKMYAHVGRSEYSGKPETPDDLRELAERKLNE